MTIAPNETPGQYVRKIALMAKRDRGYISTEELMELQELTLVARSHLTLVKPEPRQ